MANEYYSHGGYPASGASGSSAAMRAELDAVDDGFDKLPTLSGNNSLPVFINSGGTALEATAVATAQTRLGIDTIVETKTHAAASKATPVDADEMPIADSAATWGLKKVTWANLKATLKAYFDTLYLAVGSGGITASSSDTLTNKSVSLTTNTLTGTKAEFDTACTDGSFAYQSDIGSSIQAYDADTAKTDVVQTFTAVQTPKVGTASVSSTSDFTYNPSTHGQTCTVTVTTTCAITLRVSAGTIVAGTHYSLILKAGDTSVRTYAHNTAEVKAPTAALPITSGTITNNAWDVLHLIGVDTNTVAVVGSAADVR